MWTADLWIVLLCSVTALYTPGKLYITVSVSLGTWFWLWVVRCIRGKVCYTGFGGGGGCVMLRVYAWNMKQLHCVATLLQCLCVRVAVALRCNTIAHFHWRKETFFEGKIVLMS